MALEWRGSSKWWYGRFTENGRRRMINLGVEIKGRRPAKPMDPGPGLDSKFVESRAVAMREHEIALEKIRSRRNLSELHQKIVEIKRGERVETVPLSELPARWAAIPRRKKPSAQYSKQCEAVLLRFAEFVGSRWRDVDELAAVTAEQARAFLDAEEAAGASAKTWNDRLKLLRATFKHLEPEADAYRRFLATAPTKESATVFRRPFTPEELGRILEAAQEDEFIRPVIVTAICTAMRRGDVCRLRWENVDLAGDYITVKTSKTGAPVAIPIFALLRDELLKLPRKAAGFVFPDQAHKYESNPDSITNRVQRVLIRALHPDAGANDDAPERLPLEEIRRRGHDYLERLGDTPKVRRMRAVFDAYMDGKPGADIRESLGVSKATVSAYLNQIEGGADCTVVRGRAGRRSVASLAKTDAEVLRVVREGSQRRASVRDMHAFRVTWVTLALTAGVPVELVQKVTGHRSVEVVLKHYFQPGREAFRDALEKAMPRLMIGSGKTREQEAAEVLRGMTAETWRDDRDRALAVLGVEDATTKDGG